MRVHFYLDNPSKPTSYVYLVAVIKRQRLKFYTEIHINTNDWDKKAERLKGRRGIANKDNYNRHLDYLQQLAYDKYYEIIREGRRPTAIEIKDYLREKTFKAPAKNQITLIQFWERFIEQRTQDPSFSAGTVKTYLTSLNHFKAFCKTAGHHDFKQIDLRFIQRYKDYFYSKKLSTNHMEKMVQQLRVVLNQATEEGINTKMDYKKKAFRVKKTATDEIYLSLNEINEIRKLSLSEGMQTAQYTFLIQCYTGVAYSDIPKISKANKVLIDGIHVITYNRNKTKKLAAIPVHPIVNTIMIPFDWQPIKPLSNQAYNRYLKEIGEMAGITDIVKKVSYPGGQEKVTLYPKNKLIGSHTARRSFTTNYILSGGTRDEVKLMIGHMKQDVTETYIKAEMQKRAALLSDRPFFQLKSTR